MIALKTGVEHRPSPLKRRPKRLLEGFHGSSPLFGVEGSKRHHDLSLELASCSTSRSA